MSDPVQIAIIAALAGLVPSVFGFLNGRQIKVLKEQTDGKLSALTDAVKGQATAEGTLTGLAQARAETKEDANTPKVSGASLATAETVLPVNIVDVSPYASKKITDILPKSK